MKVEYEIRPDDLIEFNMFHLSMDKRAQRALRIQLGIPLVIIFLIILYQYFEKNVTFVTGILIFAGIAVVWTYAYRKFFRKLVENKMRKILKKSDYKENFGPKTMEFHDKYLMETTGGRKKKLFYKDVFRSVETKTHIYIYEGPGIAYTLPKEFLTEEQIEEIKDKLGMKAV